MQPKRTSYRRWLLKFFPMINEVSGPRHAISASPSPSKPLRPLSKFNVYVLLPLVNRIPFCQGALERLPDREIDLPAGEILAPADIQPQGNSQVVAQTETVPVPHA